MFLKNDFQVRNKEEISSRLVYLQEESGSTVLEKIGFFTVFLLNQVHISFFLNTNVNISWHEIYLM